MPGLSSSLFTGVSGVLANQNIISAIGHNLSNVNTEGYSRQRVNVSTREPETTTPGQFGRGVTIKSIVRTKNMLIQGQQEKEETRLGFFETRSDELQRLESILNEPTTTGLVNAMQGFFDTWHELSNDPENTGVRSSVKEQGQRLADTLSNLNTRLEDVRNSIDRDLEIRVSRVNTLTANIASLNERISQIESGGINNANDLRDERDKVILNLRRLMDIRTNEDENGTLFIENDSGVFVAGSFSYAVETISNSEGHLNLRFTSTQDAIVLQNGALKALLDIRDTDVPSITDDLDSIASTIIEQVNNIHAAGFGLTRYSSLTSNVALTGSTTALNSSGVDYPVGNGSFWLSVYDDDGDLSGEAEISVTTSSTLTNIRDAINADAVLSGAGLSASITSDNKLTIVASGNTTFGFVSDSTQAGDTSGILTGLGMNTFFTGTGARTIDVSTTIKNDVDKIAAAKTTQSGNNENAVLISNLNTALLMNANQLTLNEFYASTASSLGTDIEVARQNFDNSESFSQLLFNQQQRASGVNINEEVVDLLRYQQAFQASAQFVQTISGLMSVVLSLAR